MAFINASQISFLLTAFLLNKISFSFNERSSMFRVMQKVEDESRYNRDKLKITSHLWWQYLKANWTNHIFDSFYVNLALSLNSIRYNMMDRALDEDVIWWLRQHTTTVLQKRRKDEFVFLRFFSPLERYILVDAKGHFF